MILPRVLTQAVAVAIEFEIFVLCGDVGFARFDGAELVVAGPAIRHFLLSSSHVETPAGVGLDEWQWQRPAILPNAQNLDAVRAIVDQPSRRPLLR